MAKLYNLAMTLKARNNFTLIMSTLFLALSMAILVYLLYNLNLLRKGHAILSYNMAPKGLSLFQDNLWTLFIEAFLVIIYIPLAAFYIYARFEKTASNEVAYFLIFLLGCVPELFRLFIPLETVQGSYPSLLVFAGRALFWGRTLAFISLFAASISAAPNKNLNAEQNIFILLLFSLAIAGAAPINTTKISPSFNIQTGWTTFLYLLYGVAAVLTMISYAVNARSNENPLFIRMGVDILCVEAGLLILNSSAILAAALAGALLLFVGTFRYFMNLHKAYA